MRCWVCKHDVPEAETKCVAGVGTSCKDRDACRARQATPMPGAAMIAVERVRGFAIVKLSPEVTRCVLCATDWTPGEKERHADFCPAIGAAHSSGAELTQENAERCYRDGFAAAVDACAEIAVREQAYWRPRGADGQSAAENIEGLIRKLAGQFTSAAKESP
jgi:hypothetical protein